MLRIIVVGLCLLWPSKSLLWGQNIDSLFRKCDSLLKVGRYQKANNLAWSTLQQAINTNDIKAQGIAYYLLALSNQRRGDYKTSIDYCLTGKKIAASVSDTLTLLRCIYINARNFTFLALYRNASRELFPALQMAENFQNIEIRIQILLAIGNVYRLEDNHELALKTHLKARELAQQHPNILNDVYNNIGITHFYHRDYAQALLYYDSAFKAAHEVGDKFAQVLMLNNFGLLYNELHLYDSAKQKLQTSLVMNQDQFYDLRLLCYTLQGLAKNALSRGNRTEAKNYVLRAVQAGQKTNLRRELSQAYLLASLIDSASSNWRSAYQWQLRYSQLSDSIRQDNLSVQAYYFEVELERERNKNSLKEMEANLLIASKEKLLAEEEAQLQRERNFLILAIALGFVLAVAIALLLWHNRDVRQKNLRLKAQKTAIIEINRQLELRNQEINQQKEEIFAQAEHLNQLNDLKDRLFFIMSHELKGPLSSLGGVINLFEAGMLSQEETVMLMKNLRKDFSVLNEAFSNIFLWSNAMNPSTLPDKTAVPLLPIFAELSAWFGQKARKKGIQLSIEVPTDAVIWADRYHVFILFKNLIDNAIKFTPPNGKVSFEAIDKAGHWEISIKDTGVGIRDEDLPKLFDLHTHFKTYGTLDEKGAGLGLLLCKEFAQKNDGKIWVESQPDKGSRFVVAFPKYEV